jgi:hypothetical protein
MRIKLINLPVIAGTERERSDSSNLITRALRSSSSTCFPLNSLVNLDSPVVFPPARARLATNPQTAKQIGLTIPQSCYVGRTK